MNSAGSVSAASGERLVIRAGKLASDIGRTDAVRVSTGIKMSGKLQLGVKGLPGKSGMLSVPENKADGHLNREAQWMECAVQGNGVAFSLVLLRGEAKTHPGGRLEFKVGRSHKVEVMVQDEGKHC